MKNRKFFRWGILLGGIIICLSGFAYAQNDEPSFDYDIFIENDSIAIWLDITPALTQPLMEDILAGLRVFVAVRISIEHPPHPLFSKIIVQKDISFLISRDIAKDKYILLSGHSSKDSLLFSSQIALSDYLADSLDVTLASLQSFGKAEKLRVVFELVTKSCSDNMLGGAAQRQRRSENKTDTDIFNRVFSHFLDFIGFGKNSYRIQSPVFHLSELNSYPSQD